MLDPPVCVEAPEAASAQAAASAAELVAQNGGGCAPRVASHGPPRDHRQVRIMVQARAIKRLQKDNDSKDAQLEAHEELEDNCEAQQRLHISCLPGESYCNKFRSS